jgi:hypothetical protein
MTQNPLIDELIDAIFKINICDELRELKNRDIDSYNMVKREMLKMNAAVS